MVKPWHFSMSLCVLLLSCSNNLGVDGKNSKTNGVNFSGASASLELWQRGPTLDGDDLALDATGNLDSVGRTSLPLYDLLDSSGALSGPYFDVVDSATRRESVKVSDWLGKFIPWRNNVDFKLLMAFSHLSTAKRRVQTLFSDVPFSGGGLDIDHINVFAAEVGDPLNTGYSAINGQGYLEFFRNSDSSYPYSTADEADAIYHEFGHTLQHALNKGILENAGNYDMDSLLEGLSDFFAAAMVNDDFILSYLNSNSRNFFEGQRTGPTHNRHLRHRLSFPKSYVSHLHLDGRIVAGAINDIRKLLMGESITLENCSGTCTVSFSSKKVTAPEAWDLALRISHLPLRKLVQSSTLQRYAERLYEEVAEGSDVKNLCASSQACINELKSDVSLLLQGRGLLSWSNFPRYSRKLTLPGQSGVTDPELILYSYPAFIPVGQELGLSDNDTVIEPCEAIVLLPNMKNNTDQTNTRAQMFETTASLLSISRFQNLTDSNGDLSEDTTGRVGSDSRVKILGWMSPGERTWDLSRSASSLWYRVQPAVASQLATFPSVNNLPSSVGWAVRAPSSGSVSARFNIRVRVYNTISNVESYVTDFNVTQTAVIPTDQSNFCN
ncbi:hypothetical protein GW915_08935 [bacterium]|nr:hypothetical protein [bacterium]